MFTFFRLSLLSPLLIPMVVIGAASIFDSASLSTMAGYFGLTLIFGGIPYLLFAAYGFIWLRAKSERQIVRRALVAPLIFVPVAVVPLIAFLLILSVSRHTPFDAWDVFSTALMAGEFILGFGYFYVALTLLVYYIVKQSGSTHATPSA